MEYLKIKLNNVKLYANFLELQQLLLGFYLLNRIK